MARVIGMARPRLKKAPAWHNWRVSVDGTLLVYTKREGGNYQIDLEVLKSLGDAQLQVENVALKSAWAGQHVVDHLRRALRDLKGFIVPFVEVPR